LDQEDIKILSLGAIWNFDKGTGLSWARIRLRGTNSPSTRPWSIRTVRAQTQCKSIYLSVCLSVYLYTGFGSGDATTATSLYCQLWHAIKGNQHGTGTKLVHNV